jgi:outer membrane autotransporter protein
VTGQSGSGTLNITNSGKVAGSYGYLGYEAGSNGTAMVDGAGSNWANDQMLFVGLSGKGSLTVSNGGTVNSVYGLIGDLAGSTGTVTVKGPNSLWTNTADLQVGGEGKGTLAIQNGGQVKSGSAWIGAFAGSTGVATVDGPGSKWTVAGDLVAGESGTGTLAISAGGKAASTYAYVGRQAGSSGTATVDGAGSSWASEQALFVGMGGTGSLTVSNGAAVSTQFGLIGAFQGGKGAVVVKGANSLWTDTAGLQVGGDGAGSLAILNQGEAKSHSASVGTFATSTGTATVDGPGSKWTIANELVVGDTGHGSLAITNAGRVGNGTAFIGNAAGATGAVVVDGPGSNWTSSYIVAGNEGTGSLSIANGAVVNALGGMAVAASAGSAGAVNVSASALNLGSLSVGALGSGTLNITNSGKVGNDVAWVGDFAGGTGKVVVDGAGSAWNNSADLYIGRVGHGLVTIANGGVVTVGGQVKMATNAGAVGILGIGGAPGAAPAAPGTLNTSGINFGGGNSTGILGFNHTDTSGGYSFGAAISGGGRGSAIIHDAGWTNLTGNSSGFNGSTQVNGGRLAVNGSLANSLVYVNSGGTLGGAGTVGSTLVAAGGKAAPGNSIGTLKVNGDMSFAAGSLYEAEVNGLGASDKITVSGIATLGGGTVQVIPLTGKGGIYGHATNYTLLSATGGVAGNFAGATSSQAFLTPSLSYDPKNVYLTLTRNTSSFGSVATNALQRSTATGVESLVARNPASPVYQAVVTLSAPQARAAFDQLSGEVHASTRGVQLENSHLTRDVSLERLRIAGNEDTGNEGGASEDGSSAPRLLRSLREPSFWSRAMGSWGTMDGNGAASVRRDSAGFMLGVDTRVGEEGRFGLMGGYGNSSFDVNTRSASGNSDNYTVGAYGGTRWGDLALRGGVAYTWQDVSTRRTVAFTGFTDSLAADYKANTTQLFAELGWRIKREQSEFEPFVNLSHVNVSSDGFTERGGAASLTSASSSSGVTFSTLGVRASTLLSSGGTDVTARGSLGWRHAFGDTSPTTAAAFGGSSAFEMTGAPVAKSVGVIEAGLDFKLSNTATLGVTYGGQFGSGLKEHSARVQLHVAF